MKVNLLLESRPVVRSSQLVSACDAAGSPSALVGSTGPMSEMSVTPAER
jgi:hypothetical protein